MTPPKNRHAPPENRLLSSLQPKDLKRLRVHMEQVSLKMGDVAYESDQPIQHAYFPLTGVMSLVTTMEDGAAVEIATVGNEGMIGLPLFLGVDQTAGRAFAQVPGESIRIPAEVFQIQVRRSREFSRMLQLYTQALMTQISQGMACNAAHSLRKRCARWLVMTHDRVAADRFPLSQQFLAQMLGVRRQSVGKVASFFQDEGMIRYSRGVIEFLDRKRVEASACECYGVVQKEFERLLGAPQKQG